MCYVKMYSRSKTVGISIYWLRKSSVHFSIFHMIKIKDGISTKQELNRETSIRNQKFPRIFRRSFFDLTSRHYKGLHEIRLYFSSNYVSYYLQLLLRNFKKSNVMIHQIKTSSDKFNSAFNFLFVVLAKDYASMSIDTFTPIELIIYTHLYIFDSR